MVNETRLFEATYRHSTYRSGAESTLISFSDSGEFIAGCDIDEARAQAEQRARDLSVKLPSFAYGVEVLGVEQVGFPSYKVVINP
jgi:hypothetical protein